MTKYYSDEINVQIIIALLKAHGIKQVIASPGSANSPLVASMQYDSYFEMYSSVDERSAAYMACGLAAETGEPVVISCTGATASRNYLPGLTEAFYRKLPVLAITSTRAVSKIGHLVDQVIDRSIIPNDIARISVTLPIVKNNGDRWECEIKTNSAILELKRHGGGPAHINLPTNYTGTFTTKELPEIHVINRYTAKEEFPQLPSGKIAVFVGSTRPFSQERTSALDLFCETNNGIVLCDHTSGYKGKYRISAPIVFAQSQLEKSALLPELLIHVGEISGSYGALVGNVKDVWRVSEDGEIRDTFNRLSCVFEVPEHVFFNHYANNETDGNDSYFKEWRKQIDKLNNDIAECPFSNVWIAQQLASQVPESSIIHFGILNSLTSWNYFELPQSVLSYSNVGGYGIDGCLSSLIGASLSDNSKLYFGVIGDLAFFYDMNSLGNRHVGSNLRIIVVNNGMGVEFKIKGNQTVQFGEGTNEYIAAAGHFGNKSPNLIKNYATDLGFEYMSASNKEEFALVVEDFISSEINNKSKLLEVFTSDEDERLAHELMSQIVTTVKGRTKQLAKGIIGEGGIKVIKKLMK